MVQLVFVSSFIVTKESFRIVPTCVRDEIQVEFNLPMLSDFWVFSSSIINRSFSAWSFPVRAESSFDEWTGAWTFTWTEVFSSSMISLSFSCWSRLHFSERSGIDFVSLAWFLTLIVHFKEMSFEIWWHEACLKQIQAKDKKA